MKEIVMILILGLAARAGADTFVLKDGARIEGEVAGEMDSTVLVKTKYGSLTISKSDIQEQKPSEPAQQLALPPPPAVTAAPAVQPSVPAATPAVQASSVPAAAVSTQQPAAAASTAVIPAAEQIPLPKFTFTTVLPSTSTRLALYCENGLAIATETYDAGGALLSTEGLIKDGTYTEYYDNGGLKTVKTMTGGKAGGTLKAFYPSGTLQLEAYYLAGAKDGPFKYYSEDGKPLLETVYKADKLNGWKREYDAAGALKSETYYTDDHLAEAPKPKTEAAAPAQPQEPDSLVTVKTMELARGERFSFQLNGKYIGKLTLDKNFNILGFDGSVPDGAAKAYSKEGKLQKEFVFGKNALKSLRVYLDGGPLQAEYVFIDDQAVKK